MKLFKKEKRSYSDEMRKFALTLHSCSTKAYKHVRSVLPLPCVRTIGNWLASVDGGPGFFKESGQYLQEKISQGLSEYRLCSLVVDGMSLRKKIEWQPGQQRHVGYVDYGHGPQVHLGAATEAITFMCIGLQGQWKIPVGYLLINRK